MEHETEHQRVPPPDPPRFRVELRQPARSRRLAVLDSVPPHRRTLDPFVSRLLLEGAEGTVVLVDEATGRVVARRTIAPPGGLPHHPVSRKTRPAPRPDGTARRDDPPRDG